VATDIFARIGAIKGESTDNRHPDEIEVLSFSWGLTHSGPVGHGAGAGAGKATFQDLAFVHHVDRASPLLMKACATGEHIPDATITVRRAGASPQDYLIITMSDVVITGVSMSVDEAAATAEQVTLSGAKVGLEYKRQKPDGTLEPGVPFSYDLKANRSG
jgi:type VI secretion system secreted protein Hcp